MNWNASLKPAGLAIREARDEIAALDFVAGRVLVRAFGQRRGLIQHVARIRDHLGAAHRVVALALFRSVGFGDHVGAVERVIERAPASVRRVERIACVQDGHHQLRPGLQGKLRVHVGGGGLGACRRRHEVADLLQEAAIGRHVPDRAGVGLVPAVELRLQAIAFGQQGDVLGSELLHDGVEATPEIGAAHAGAGQHLLFDKAMQFGGHLQSMDGGACGHEVSS